MSSHLDRNHSYLFVEAYGPGFLIRYNGRLGRMKRPHVLEVVKLSRDLLMETLPTDLNTFAAWGNEWYEKRQIGYKPFIRRHSSERRWESYTGYNNQNQILAIMRNEANPRIGLYLTKPGPHPSPFLETSYEMDRFKQLCKILDEATGAVHEPWVPDM